MKFLARLVMVLALLGTLAYGSFAFGKYVLSNHLFGETKAGSGALRTVSRSTTQATAVTRRTNWKGNKPRVEVRVLPADQAGPAPDVAALADEDNLSTQRSSDDSDSSGDSFGAPKSKLGKRRFDDAAVEYSLGKRSESGDRSRRRFKRRRKSSRQAKSDDAAVIQAVRRGEANAPPGDGASSSQGDADAGTITTGGQTSRERNSSVESRTTSSTPRRERERPRRRIRPRRQPRGESRETPRESPVPKPEGNSSSGDDGGESPVPQPE